MKTGEEFYSKNLKRVVKPGEDIYLKELKRNLVEKINFYKSAGCGAAGCNANELYLKNELYKVTQMLESSQV